MKQRAVIGWWKSVAKKARGGNKFVRNYSIVD